MPRVNVNKPGPSQAEGSVHGLVSHSGEGKAVSAALAALTLLAPGQQGAGALAVHEALPAILFVVLQQCTPR